MKPETREIMEFIPKFANDGRGKTFSVKAAWREYTGQKVGRPLKIKVNGIHINAMSAAIKKLKNEGKLIPTPFRSVWEWIGD